MSAWLVVMLVIWGISAIGLIVFVLLHSGKGTGLSEMLGGAVSPTSVGTEIVEKNLGRITIIFAAAFMISLLILAFVYPTGV